MNKRIQKKHAKMFCNALDRMFERNEEIHLREQLRQIKQDEEYAKEQKGLFDYVPPKGYWQWENPNNVPNHDCDLESSEDNGNV